MSMSLGEVLDMPVVRAGGPRVLAGEADLDRQVRWVHTGEIADIAQFLRGGEVLLTAGTGIPATESARRRYVRELGEVGVLAVVIELGRAFRSIPPEMVEEARRRGLVLVSLDREVPFMPITEAVHATIINRQYQTLTRANEIAESFTEVVLEGAELPRMLRLLAQELRNPVVLEDNARHVVGMAPYSGSLDSVVGAWQLHARTHHPRGTGVLITSEQPRCAWTVVALKGEAWGRLHVLEADSPLDSVTSIALDRAAAAIALHLLAERGAGYLTEAAELELVQDIVLGRRFDPTEFLARTTGLGVDLHGELVVLVATPEGREVVAELAAALREAMRTAGRPALVSPVGGRVVVVAASGGSEELREALADVAGVIGVSEPAPAASLPRALREAEAAQRLGPTVGSGPVHLYGDLAIHRLLAPLLDGPELSRFVESELAPLIEHDARRRSSLVATLDAYLEAGSSKTEAAALLHLQRRSIYYRLEQIQRLLGRDIDDPHHRTRLYIALRARELLLQREATASAP